jgi:hypothetical protein
LFTEQNKFTIRHSTNRSLNQEESQSQLLEPYHGSPLFDQQSYYACAMADFVINLPISGLVSFFGGTLN